MKPDFCVRLVGCIFCRRDDKWHLATLWSPLPPKDNFKGGMPHIWNSFLVHAKKQKNPKSTHSLTYDIFLSRCFGRSNIKFSVDFRMSRTMLWCIFSPLQRETWRKHGGKRRTRYYSSHPLEILFIFFSFRPTETQLR